MPVRFYLEHRSGYPATRPVTLTLFVRRHRAHKLKIATPFRVEPRHWSVPLGRLKPSAPGATDVNAALLELRAFTESLVALGASDDDVRERVKERFGVPPRPRQPLLKDLYAEFVVWKEGQTQPSTMRTYRALQKHLEAFAPTATVADVGGDFATDFGAYLVREGHSNPNVNKLTTRVKAFLDYLVKRKLIERAEGAKPLATPRNAPLYLTLEELDTLIAADLSGLPQRHRDARDLFIAETVTGQRYSDLVAMKWEQLDLARSIWAMPVKKTPTALRVPLPPPLMRIIEDRRGEPTPLPVLSNEYANEYLKEVCRVAGLDSPVTKQILRGTKREAVTGPKWQFMTTHVARRTFITLSLQNGVPVSELLGYTHENLSSLQLYAGQSDEGRRQHFDRIFGHL